MKLLFLEHIFSDAADGADPVIRQIFEGRARSDAVVGIADSRVVLIAAGAANVFIHRDYLPISIALPASSEQCFDQLRHLGEIFLAGVPERLDIFIDDVEACFLELFLQDGVACAAPAVAAERGGRCDCSSFR